MSNRARLASKRGSPGKRSPLRIILDSNMLITPPEYHIDIFMEIPRVLGRKVELVLPSAVYEEIVQIASQRDGGAARIALQLAKKCRTIDVRREKGESVDDTIVRLAQDLSSPVATNDRPLRKRLRSLKVPVVSMRGKGRLELHGTVDSARKV